MKCEAKYVGGEYAVRSVYTGEKNQTYVALFSLPNAESMQL